MHSNIQKWGNSLAIRLPKPFISQINISENSLVEITVENGAIIIRPIKKKVINIDELINAITPENAYAEISTGESVGKEAW